MRRRSVAATPNARNTTKSGAHMHAVTLWGKLAKFGCGIALPDAGGLDVGVGLQVKSSGCRGRRS